MVLCERYGVDAIRYFLLRDIPFGSDGTFSNEALITRINSDLANDLGNLVSRTVAMVNKYFGGTIPTERTAGEFDEDLIALATATKAKVEAYADEMQFSQALTELWALISRTNKYIDETAPWVLAKDEANRARLAAVMYNLCEAIRIISILVSPSCRTPRRRFRRSSAHLRLCSPGSRRASGACCRLAFRCRRARSSSHALISPRSSRSWRRSRRLPARRRNKHSRRRRASPDFNR